MIPQRHQAAIANIAKRLNRTFEDVAEFFEERAAIREFCSGITRESAERAALLDISKMEQK